MRFVGIESANINQHIARIRITSNDADSGYIFQYLSQPEVRQYYNKITTGLAYPQISLQQVRETKIPLPPLLEQRAIAAALGEMDALIAALDSLIAKKRDIKQAAMQQLLTGKTRLLGFDGASEPLRQGYKQTEIGIIPIDWDVARIVDVASITTGSRNTQDRVDEGLFPFFVRSQTVERINNYSFDGEAVLTAGDGVGTGKVFHYINGKFDFHQRVYKISEFSDRLIGYYFYLYFSNNFFDRIMSMTAKFSRLC